MDGSVDSRLWPPSITGHYPRPACGRVPTRLNGVRKNDYRCCLALSLHLRVRLPIDREHIHPRHPRDVTVDLFILYIFSLSVSVRWRGNLFMSKTIKQLMLSTLMIRKNVS